MLYIRLFHGRKSPEERLDDWGSDGPTLGPFEWIHMTYVCEIKLGVPKSSAFNALEIIEDLVYYDGIYYGDFTILDHPALKKDGLTPVRFLRRKARITKVAGRQGCRPAAPGKENNGQSETGAKAPPDESAGPEGR